MKTTKPAEMAGYCGENNKAPRFYLGALNPAERTGFEPANRFCRLHAFQACLFNHSSTSPFVFAAAKLQRKARNAKYFVLFLSLFFYLYEKWDV